MSDGSNGIAGRLRENPCGFELFQAVRLLLRVQPLRKPLGGFEHPDDEAVRFEAGLSTAFPASEIQQLVDVPSARADRPALPVMRVNIMGLTGPLGVLPRHYTELIADGGSRLQPDACRAFFDIFNHRLISLLYRSWETNRLAMSWERGGEGPFFRALRSVVGIGTAALQRRHGAPDEVLLHYAGLLSQRPRSAAALECLLTDYFDMPVVVEQFSGEMVLMNRHALTRVGSGGENNRLGTTSVLWERLWDPHARFRLVVGPLTRCQFGTFLPGREGFRRMVELTRFCVGDAIGFEIHPMLRADEVPPCEVRGTSGSRLGWSSWLKTAAFGTSPEQPVLMAQATPAAVGGAV